ncbi:MAG TPA: hypothetical protein VM784_06970 [Actinomycetota bacterium]|nr:hypothetical protein [Actinomycetota bacterium]
MNRDPLVDALLDLAGAVEFPEVPDVRGAVRARLGARRSLLGRFFPYERRPVAFAAAVVVVVAVASGLLFASPGIRRAVADFLGLPGVRVEFGADAPTPAPSEDDVDAVFGRRVSVGEAEDAVSFPLPLPAGVAGDPAAFLPGKGAVALGYPASADLPEIESTGYGVIVVALPDFPPERYFGKLLAGKNPIFDEVEVDGRRGFWARAGVHTLSFDGRLRSSGNALLWEAGGITFRVETALGLARTLSIAESIPDG